MFEYINDTLELLTLDKAGLSLGISMSMSILKLFWTIRLTMSSLVVVGYSVFINSLLDATIQDGSRREKSGLQMLMIMRDNN